MGRNQPEHHQALIRPLATPNSRQLRHRFRSGNDAWVSPNRREVVKIDPTEIPATATIASPPSSWQWRSDPSSVKPRNCTVILLKSAYPGIVFVGFFIAIGFTGCGVEKPKSAVPKQPTGVITRSGVGRDGTSGAGTTIELSNQKSVTETDSTAPEVVQQAAILDSVLRLLTTAGTNPGGDNFTIATEQLNQYFNRNATGAEFTLNQPTLEYLTTIQIPETAIKALQEPKFSIRDARHIEDCMMYYGLANRIAGNGDDLTRLRRIFEWTCRNVMLVPAGSLAPPGKNQQAQARPYDCILRGMGSEVTPAWAERTWIFMSLARQIRIDVGILVSSRAPNQWLSLALVDGKPYLFDCRVGRPILSVDGSTVATLDEAIRDPRIMAAMQLAGSEPYGPNNADLAAGELNILADLATGYLSPRMRLLEQRLAGKNRMILFRDVADLRAEFFKVLKPRLKDVRLWELPLEVEALLFSNPEFVQASQFPLQIFDFKLPLLAARTDQLRGESVDALQKLVNMRFAENAVLRDKVTPISSGLQKIIDIYSTYFLGLAYLENSYNRSATESEQKQADLKQARFFFNETLRLTPEPTPERPFFYMFRWGAASNIGLIAQEAGELPTAIRYLSASYPTAQGYGNLLTATSNVWADPFGASPAPLPPAPEDKNQPANTGAQDVFNTAPATPPTAPANRPLPGLGGAPLNIPGPQGRPSLPTGGPRPVGPGGAFPGGINKP